MAAEIDMTTCAKCGGGMTAERDKYGCYWSCVCCGAEVNVGPDWQPLQPLPLVRIDGGRLPGLPLETR